MTLNSDCSISGLPTQAGSFPIVVHLGASGVSNQLDWNASVLVLGPSLVYSMPATISAGSNVSIPTLNSFWTATAADTVTYSIVGTLPPGLAIDAGTGQISGMPTTEGSYTFRVAVQTQAGSLSASQVQDIPNIINVATPRFPYNNTVAWAGLAFVSTPTLPGSGGSYQFTASSLPPGLTIDPTTGVISGTATQPGPFSTAYDIGVTATGSSGGAFSTTTTLTLNVSSPVYINYPGTWGTLNAPYSDTPTFTNNSGVALNGISYSYALDPASTLPTGLALNPTTGEISGTPTSYAGTTVTVNVTISLNGVSFVEPVSTVISVQ